MNSFKSASIWRTFQFYFVSLSSVTFSHIMVALTDINKDLTEELRGAQRGQRSNARQM